jgi:hypothetical protein
MTFDLQAFISDHSSWLPASIWKVVPPFTFLWAAYHINQYLNTRALNNGVQATFDWKKEIVLVTGGSDGIGAETVLKLAERETTVIVLDIRPLKFDARKKLDADSKIFISGVPLTDSTIQQKMCTTIDVT